MKRIFFALALLINIAVTGFSQQTNLYSFFVNIVNEGFRFPLIGFVNIAKGNHSLPQIGFINWNTNDFSTFQAGFVNTVGGNASGGQLGFINTSAESMNGFQVGFINSSRNFNGTQIGFINTALNGGNGFQLGFINTSFQRLQGVQIGFINYVDSIEDGIPIGFISIVRNGGYRAIEYSFSEFHSINIGIKLGVDRFYTTIIVAYNPFEDFSRESFALGLGVGTLIPVNNFFFFNPELNSLSVIGNNSQLLSFVPNFGFNINKNFSITVGPAITWVANFNGNGEVIEPLFSIFSHDINERHTIIVGTRASIRFRF